VNLESQANGSGSFRGTTTNTCRQITLFGPGRMPLYYKSTPLQSILHGIRLEQLANSWVVMVDGQE
jgi:hypothetical protein